MSSYDYYSSVSQTADSVLNIGTIIGIVIGSLAGLTTLIAITVIIIILCKKKRPVLIMPQAQQQQQQQMFQMGSYGQGPWQAPPYYILPPTQQTILV
jgi:hypothetical protein